MVSSLVTLFPLLAVAAAAPFKRAESQLIHINGDAAKCLSVDKLEDGSPVVNVPCDNGFHNAWTIQDGNNVNGIQLTGTNFCLDAGSHPGNFGKAKVWTCYPGLKQQTWWYTGDKHIAITNGDQCLDVGQDYVQTYRCFGGNTNQMWTVSPATPPPPPVVDPLPPVQIHFNASSTGCLQVLYGAAGAEVHVNICAKLGPPFLLWQQFDLKRNTPGLIPYSVTPSLCLDASPTGATTNGSPITLQTCDPTLAQQQWYYTDDNHIAVLGGTQCLQVVKDSLPRDSVSYGSLQTLQTWQCDGTDPQQVFTI